jgi:hypothetical protein
MMVFIKSLGQRLAWNNEDTSLLDGGVGVFVNKIKPNAV